MTAPAPAPHSLVPALPPTPDLQHRLSGSPLLILLDIDGTLAPIAPTPEEASVPSATRRAVRNLVRLAAVHVAAVTGRAAPDGRRMVDVDGLWVIGNHGMERIDPSGGLHVNPQVAPYQARVAQAAASLTTLVGDVPGIIVENKLWTLSVHYRLADHAAVPGVEKVLRDVARELALRVTAGKEVFELRPPVDVNKGTAAVELARELGVREASQPPSSVLYAGDDRTDEDAFRLLREWRGDAVTIHVGDPIVSGEPTAAEFLVANPEAMRELLDWIRTIR